VTLRTVGEEERAMDVLSDVLSAVRLTGAIYFDIDAGNPWVGESPGTAAIAAAIMPTAEHIISFHIVLAGGCWAAMADGSVPPVWLDAGDVVVFPSGAPNVLSSARGARGRPNPLSMYYRPVDEHLPFEVIHGGDGPDRTRFVCGFLGCDSRPFNPLLSALPPLLCIPQSAGALGISDLFAMALAEGKGARAGSETVLAKLSELMFVEVLRRHIEDLPEDARGWLAGLGDSHLGEVLRLLHSRPAEAWTIDSLARAAGMSRSVLASRFSAKMEVSPMQYLARWRMHLAARRLEDPHVSIGQAAADVGYESEAAFNRAFKKFVGVPPGAWRRGGHRRDTSTVDAGPGPI
jgi:AraC-like DNA-binding protein